MRVAVGRGGIEPDLLQRGFNQLPLLGLRKICEHPAQRHLVELAVVHGKSHKEISTSTGLPLGTVKSTISRTLARLRNELLAQQAAA